MDKERIVFNLTLKAESEIAVSPIDSELPGDESSKNGKNPPRRLPRIRPTLNAMAYLPSSTLRHMIRKNAFLSLVDLGITLPSKSVLVLAKGYVSQEISESAAKKKEKNRASTKAEWLAEMEIRKANPFIDLFGYGLGFPGTLAVGHAFPVVENEKYESVIGLYNRGVRMPLSDEEIMGISESDQETYFRILELLGGAAEEKKAEKKKSRQAKQRQESIEAGRVNPEVVNNLPEEEEKEKKKETQLQNPYPPYEAFNPGVQFDWRIEIRRASKEKVGFVLAALERISADPVVGAHAANGAGRISITGDIYRMSPGEKIIEGKISLGDGFFDVSGNYAGILSEWREIILSRDFSKIA